MISNILRIVDTYKGQVKLVSIRTKTLLIIIIAFIVNAFAAFCIADRFILKRFIDFEEQTFEKDNQRVLETVNYFRENLESIASDWAPWNDTYTFASQYNEKYITDNLMDETFTNLNLNLFLLLNNDGKILYSTLFDTSTFQKKPLIQEYADTIKESIQNGEKDGSFSGLIYMDKPMIIALHPILKSDFSGPSKGFLVVGRYFDDSALKQVSTYLDISLKILPTEIDNEEFNSELKELKPWHTKYNSLSSSFLEAQTLIPDIAGNPIFLLATAKERTLFHYGHHTVIIVLFLFLGAQGVLATFILLFLNKTILFRLHRMANKVKEISHTTNLDLRVSDEGKDEITFLSHTINNMIDNIQKILDAAPDMFFICDINGNIILSNTRACQLLDYEKEDLVGHPLNAFIGRNPLPVFAQKETALVRKNGDRIPVEFQAQKLSLGNRKLILSIARDISHRKDLENRLYHMAYRDSLTGLPNRASFMERLHRILGANKRGKSIPFLFIMMDVDHFKNINDTCGHLYGDRVLREVGKRLHFLLSENDVFARLGGDEFVLLLLHKDKEDGMAFAEKVKEVMKDPLKIKNVSITLSLSMGIITKAECYNSITDLFRDCDVALYEAKRLGGNTAVFFNEGIKKASCPQEGIHGQEAGNSVIRF